MIRYSCLSSTKNLQLISSVLLPGKKETSIFEFSCTEFGELPLILISQNHQTQYNYNLQISQHRDKVPPSPMSVETHTPINNDVRYEIKLKYHKENNYVVYEMMVHDLAFGKQQILVFRFSEIKKFHESLVKNHKALKDAFPEFPKTNSFGFWNKTNTNPRKIDDRRRELQFYFTKLFNDPIVRGLREVKVLLNHVVKQRRRTRSMNFMETIIHEEQKKNQKILSLPKTTLYSFPRSAQEDVFNQS